MASHSVRAGVLRGLSLGVKAKQTDWLHLSPGEWSALNGRLDIAEDRHTEIQELSLTPWPRQPGGVIISYN
jgi:hypothetical protein